MAASSVVPHGRRKGSVRSQQQYEETDPSQVNKYNLPELCLNLQKVAKHH